MICNIQQNFAFIELPEMLFDYDKLSSIDASAMIDPKIGPMQGVHPKPKAIPTIKVNKEPVDFFI